MAVDTMEGFEGFNPQSVMQPIAGDPEGKDLLSMRQLSADDIHDYIEEAAAAEAFVQDRSQRGVDLLSHSVLKAVMRQESTRTGGTYETAMEKLGGSGKLWSGMKSSSEAKGESLADSWRALGTQADILAIRTAENFGPAYAASVIGREAEAGRIWQRVPVLNCGDGTNEHPTQTLGDAFTIFKDFHKFEGLVVTIVGDQERYRSHHSLMIGAATLGMTVVAVESPVARVPGELVDLLGNKLQRTDDLDTAMKDTDILYMGRNPDEYSKKPSGDGADGDEDYDPDEQIRSEWLASDYEGWVVDNERLQQMRPDGIVLHPRPRRNELHPSVDEDPRMRDIQQMANMGPMRMAIIARHMGVSIIDALPDPTPIQLFRGA